MKNYVQRGDVLTVTAPANVASGAGVVIGSLFGVAQRAALSGEQVEIVTKGVFTMPRATGGGTAWAVGDRLYWDATNGVLTKTASSHKLVGVAVAVAADGDATGRAYLTGAFTL